MTNRVFFVIITPIRVCFGFFAVFRHSRFYLIIGGNSVAQVILVTSFKGGVGKTTLSANLAACLAKRRKKVLVCDCDLESRCLDMVLGVENQPLFNICDAVGGLCSVKDAICKHERVPNLSFMPAPAFYPEADRRYFHTRRSQNISCRGIGTSGKLRYDTLRPAGASGRSIPFPCAGVR